MFCCILPAISDKAGSKWYRRTSSSSCLPIGVLLFGTYRSPHRCTQCLAVSPTALSLIFMVISFLIWALMNFSGSDWVMNPLKFLSRNLNFFLPC
jgi:hypothetical protein